MQKVNDFLTNSRHQFFNGITMRLLFSVILFTISFVLCLTVAQSSTPVPILPSTFHWWSPPNMPGIQGAWILGAEQNQGLYIFRVKLESGARTPPHTHPDERNTTVLTGTISVGFGENFDESKVVAVPTGAVYIAPANVAHYIWAKDGEAVYQEAGMGSTGTIFIGI